MIYIFQLVMYCFIFTVTVSLAIRGNPLNILYFYPKEIQDRVFELGLMNKKTMIKKRNIFIPIFFAVMILSLILIIGRWNNTKDFKNTFLQALFFLQFWNIYDGLIMDKIWPENSKIFFIQGTEGIKYIPTWSELIKKRIAFIPLLAIGALVIAILVNVIY